jgi:hypothetical protein
VRKSFTPLAFDIAADVSEPCGPAHTKRYRDALSLDFELEHATLSAAERTTSGVTRCRR